MDWEIVKAGLTAIGLGCVFIVAFLFTVTFCCLAIIKIVAVLE